MVVWDTTIVSGKKKQAYKGKCHIFFCMHNLDFKQKMVSTLEGELFVRGGHLPGERIKRESVRCGMIEINPLYVWKV